MKKKNNILYSINNSKISDLTTITLLIVFLISLIVLGIFIIFSQWNIFFLKSLSIFIKNNSTIINFVIVFLILIILFVINYLRISFKDIIFKQVSKAYNMLEPNFLSGIGNLPIGIISYDRDNKIIWMNDFFNNKDKKNYLGNNIKDLLSKIKKNDYSIDIDDSTYFFPRIYVFDKHMDLYLNKKNNILFLIDKTKEINLSKYIDAKQIVIGYLYLDTPEEINVAEDSGNFYIYNTIHREILKWSKKYDAIVKKYASSRWIIFTTKDMLSEMIDNDMDIRYKISKISKEARINISVSGGFSLYTNNMSYTIKNAINAIELGQSRGGDQIVITGYGTKGDIIIGGSNNQKTRSSRVLARNFALTMSEEIEKTEVIYIISHKNADADVIGSMMAMYCICRAYNKKVYCVLNKKTISSDIIKLKNNIYNSSGEGHDFDKKIITTEEFKNVKNKVKKLLFVLDTLNTYLLEPDFIKTNSWKVLLIDHHRKCINNNGITFADIEYIDTLASSTSELVTELIQYQPIKIYIDYKTATFLLAGIILDTNNFTRNVSSRTFEAAAFLRKCGALQSDILRINSVGEKEYIKYSSYLKSSKKLKNNGRILLLDENKKRQEIAKIADFLIKFYEIKYSIVISKIDDINLIVSSRSKDKINVQSIMEKVGGGGHFNSAAAQIKNENIYEFEKRIIDIIESCS